QALLDGRQLTSLHHLGEDRRFLVLHLGGRGRRRACPDSQRQGGGESDGSRSAGVTTHVGSSVPSGAGGPVMPARGAAKLGRKSGGGAGGGQALASSPAPPQRHGYGGGGGTAGVRLPQQGPG